MSSDELSPAELAAFEGARFLLLRFFEAGVGYYMTARMAFFAHAVPVAGNLFHHALEMFMKGHLSATTDKRQRQGELRHHLSRAWTLYKQTICDPALDRFDETVAAIDPFEDLRYPENVDSYTVQLAMSGPFTRPVGSMVQSPSVRHFTIAVNDVDALVAELFWRARLTPAQFTADPSPDGLAVLRRENATGIW